MHKIKSKILILLVLFLYNNEYVYAQKNNEIDSLKQILHKAKKK